MESVSLNHMQKVTVIFLDNLGLIRPHSMDFVGWVHFSEATFGNKISCQPYLLFLEFSPSMNNPQCGCEYHTYVYVTTLKNDI